MKKLIACLMTMLLLGGGNSCFAAEEAYISFNDAQVYQEGRFGEKKEAVSLLAAQDWTEAKNAIAQSMLQLGDTVNLSQYQIPANDMNELLNDVINENPGLFFIDLVGCHGRVINGYMFSLDFSNAYRWAKEKIREKQKAILTEVSKILSNIDKEKMTVAEKALYVHDWFVLHYAYDYENYKNGTVPPQSFRIDGLFIDKTAVCQGYALGYMYVLEQLGIETVFVRSRPLMHAWNMVKIDDAWYHVDVTWDDPVADMPGRVLHNNFLLSDAAMIDSGHDDKENPLKDPSEIWESPHTAAESYKGFWENVTGAMSYKDGSWYYFRKGFIYTRTGETEKELLEIDEYWYVKDKPGFVYGEKYCNVGVFENRIYYNTPQTICTMQLDGTDDRLFKIPQIDGKDIYGLFIKENTLYYVYGYTPDEAREVSAGITLGAFYAYKYEDDVCIVPCDTVPDATKFFVAAYKGEELISIDILPVISGKKEYTSTLTKNKFDKICVFAFSGLKPLEHAITIR